MSEPMTKNLVLGDQRGDWRLVGITPPGQGVHWWHNQVTDERTAFNVGAPSYEDWYSTGDDSDVHRYLMLVRDLAKSAGPGPSSRSDLLSEADGIINGDRAHDYGPPRPSFERIAALWAPVLRKHADDVAAGKPIPPEMVAIMLTQLKVSRLVETPRHRDSWVDSAGYMALGGEMALEEEQ